jgi:hypothetical protein
MTDDGDCGAIGGINLAGEPKYSKKTCLSATFHGKFHMT